MINSRTYHGLTLDTAKFKSERICYILLPEGLKEDGKKWMEEAAERYACNIVALSGMDWNESLTPWAAEGVFRKAKPFGGRSEVFLRDLKSDYFPGIESSLGIKHPERYLAGISLSGLFAVWSVFKCDLFLGVASISGSMWYDGFAEWTKDRMPSACVKKVFISLGDKESKTKDKRMSSVEDATLQVVSNLREKGTLVEYALEEGVTHFSPVVPRLEKALESLFGGLDTMLQTAGSAYPHLTDSQI